jgi:hypothetical protein
MPVAKKPASRRQRSEPPALKRLNKALDDAQKALTDLRKDVGKDVSKGARELYGDVDKIVKNARRNTGKLGTALRKDLETLQKRMSQPGSPASPRRPNASRSKSGTRTSRSGAARRRSTGKR